MARREGLHSKAEYIAADLSIAPKLFPCSPAADHTISVLTRPYTPIVITSRVSMDCSALHDWTSFHFEFSRVFGFPAFYGKNMNAWIDCMTSLDKPEDGMSTVHCASGSIATLELSNASDLAERCP